MMIKTMIAPVFFVVYLKYLNVALNISWIKTIEAKILYKITKIITGSAI
jgi:hypothetical protein